MFLPHFLNQIHKSINASFSLQLPISQTSESPQPRRKLQPEAQTSNDSDRDVPPSAEPRRVKIFDGG